ncbi:ATP-binding cassette domain-containing protein [Usitatibacter palustris]|uniref:Cyclolysin secretion/processing ATP-binding protein CyaB n=1 Tax=Usitatibacter palustris TaxID=2732487 RepID=A0A6M4H5X0_9PROT|nr:ATP-binding cassette domain-containing protein [Usitatibacter palustris]QJR14053.1 Alpha-hemolysin translocation ATP-binding protein HlyB [Usitatibacter palustris]
MQDPGRYLKSSGLRAALECVAPALGVRFPDAEASADTAPDSLIEELAAAAGVRSRRTILDGAWWNETGPPMLARVAERRNAARALENDRMPGGTGWVALLPRALSGYRMVAPDPATGKPTSTNMDAEVASRLAPFGFTFHRGFAPQPLSARDALAFAWSAGRGDVAFVLALGLIAALVGLLTPLATGFLINKAIPAASPSTVGLVIVGLAAAGLALIVLQVARSLALFRFEASAGLAVQAAMLDRVITAPAAFFRRFASADLAIRMAAMNTVQQTLAATIVSSLVAGLFLVANLALMFWYSPKLAAIALIPVALAVAIPVAAGWARLLLARRIGKLDGELNALSFEYFTGIAKLRAAAAEPRAFGNWIAKYEELRALTGRSAQLSNSEMIAMSVLQPAVAIAIYTLMWHAITEQPEAARMPIGDFIAFQTALFALLAGVHVLVASWMDALRLKPTWERAKPILETPPERSAVGGVRHTPRGEVSLEGVSFAYPDGPDILHGIDLKVRAGEFIAIVGASGSGKTTLFRLLLGFEAPRAGRVSFDGIDVAKLDLQRLRRGVGTVLQSGKLWAGDLFTNIVGASNADVTAAWEAARLAGVAADIEAMPMGMYTLVGEGISTISGGQRQRVLVARALVEKPKVLLLDEATSALDSVAQATVLEGLRTMNATRLVIAHRLDTVRQADRIVVLEGGKIVQQGSYGELAGVPGQFANMLARQEA